MPGFGGHGTPFERIVQAYQALGAKAVQRRLQYSTDEGQQRNDRWDAESGLRACTRGQLVAAYQREGWLSAQHAAELQRPLPVRSVLLAGRKSETVGRENIAAAARQWGAELHWLENSGHFPFVEEPAAFVAEVFGFTGRPERDSR